MRTDFPDTPIAAAVQSKLDKTQDIRFAGGELAAIVAWLRQLGIPTTVEDDAETQASKENQFAALNLMHVPLDWALHRILNQHELGFFIDGGGLVIGTQKEADRRVECVVYSLGNLPGAASTTSQTDLDQLAKAVADPQSQSPNSPSWSISIVPDAGAFICVQSHEAQARFGKLLAQLRANATPAQPAAPETESSNPAAVIKVYRLAANSGKGATDASEADARNMSPRSAIWSNRRAGPRAQATSPPCPGRSSSGNRRPNKNKSGICWSNWGPAFGKINPKANVLKTADSRAVERLM